MPANTDIFDFENDFEAYFDQGFNKLINKIVDDLSTLKIVLSIQVILHQVGQLRAARLCRESLGKPVIATDVPRSRGQLFITLKLKAKMV